MNTTTRKGSQKSADQNVEALIDQLGIFIVSTGREISCRCPFHEDAHPSFSINATTGLWICYSCHASGNLERLLSDVAGETNPTKALREVKRRRHHRERSPVVPVEQKYITPPDPYHLYARYESFDSPPRWALSERMIDERCAERYGLRWAKGWIIPIWAPRVVDPIDGLMGWQFKRDYVSNYPVGVKKSHTLFGLAQCRERYAVLVESPLDVVRMASVGVSAVASFGAMVSNFQISLLDGQFDTVGISMDSDEPGRTATDRIYPLLRRRLPTQILDFPPGVKDPGDATDEQVRTVCARFSY